jgi:hypothetical protein
MFLISCWFKKKVLHISICTRFASLGVLTTNWITYFSPSFFLLLIFIPCFPPHCKAFISRIQIHLIQLMMHIDKKLQPLQQIFKGFFLWKIFTTWRIFLENEKYVKF